VLRNYELIDITDLSCRKPKGKATANRIVGEQREMAAPQGKESVGAGGDS